MCDEESLEATLHKLAGYMQGDLEDAKQIEGGGPDYTYTLQDAIDDAAQLSDDESPFSDDTDIAHVPKNK